MVSISVFACGFSFAGWGQAASDSKPPKPTRSLEMTRADVFSTPDWTSEEVRILGFHLGMSRADAVQNARKRGLILDCVDYCDVCDRQNTLCKGIGLRFGKDDHVQSIFVARPLADASQKLRKFSVTQEFKGQTYRIFHNYSNLLRLKLFGVESRREEDSLMRAAKYFYPSKGILVDVNLSPDKKVPESEADLIISFVQPENSSQLPKP